MLRAIGSKENLLDNDNVEYYSFVSDLIGHEAVLQMKQYMQHGNTSCFQHCVNVSYYNYRLCKFFSLNTRAAARAGLLHDLFLYDWHSYKKPKGKRFHVATHPKAASDNAAKFFLINDIEKDIIEKHMFPITFTLPKYKETVIIILTDKYCGLIETVAFRVQIAAHWSGKIMKKVAKAFPKKAQTDIE